jgi:TetR/AcrR family transcriptional regulator
MPGSGRLIAADRRRQLLQTALDFFSRKGFEGATTKEIAAAAGVTEAIIFRHFPSKLALYHAVLDDYHESAKVQECLGHVRACMEREDDRGFFRSLVAVILQSFREDPRMERLLMFAALEGHQQGLAHAREASYPIFEQLRDYILKRQQAGKLQDLEPSVILTAISGMAKHFAMVTQMFGYEVDMSDEQVADAFSGILMTGIQKKPSRARK